MMDLSFQKPGSKDRMSCHSWTYWVTWRLRFLFSSTAPSRWVIDLLCQQPKKAMVGHNFAVPRILVLWLVSPLGDGLQLEVLAGNNSNFAQVNSYFCSDMSVCSCIWSRNICPQLRHQWGSLLASHFSLLKLLFYKPHWAQGIIPLSRLLAKNHLDQVYRNVLFHGTLEKVNGWFFLSFLFSIYHNMYLGKVSQW